jgi:hypothetical protein
MEITPESALEIQHKAWLQHPCTKQMVEILDKQRTKYINTLAKNAWEDNSEILAGKSAVAVVTMDVTLSVMTNTNLFIQALIH